MAASPAAARTRFAAFVARALTSARGRGMTDRDIHAATGIPPSTFHRWQRGQFATAPDLDKVTAFCRGLGIPATGALAALGVTAERGETEPEPAIDPDVRRILRKLADPNVPDEEKLAIRHVLRMLGRQPRTRNINNEL